MGCIICFSVDGLSNNFKTHPLQLDHPSDSGCFDGTDYLKSNASLHESKKSNTGTPHGMCLTLTDHDRIRQFIQEFTFRGLLPHIEKTIRQLNDQVSLSLKLRVSFYIIIKLKRDSGASIGIYNNPAKSFLIWCKVPWIESLLLRSRCPDPNSLG